MESITEAPRSLKLPVGDSHSSLNRADTPAHLWETRGVQPSPIVIGSATSIGRAAAERPSDRFPPPIMLRPMPGKAVIISGAPVSERHRGSEIGYFRPLTGST